MIYQQMPRKGCEMCIYDEGKGFHVEGKNFDDCMNQLKQWCKANPDMWVYYHDCGVGISKLIPVSRHIFECMIFTEEPASTVLFSHCIQQGSSGKREIDSMTSEAKSELRHKQCTFFGVLAELYSNNARS